MMPAQQRKPLECLEDALSEASALLWAHEQLAFYGASEGLGNEGREALDLIRSLAIERQKAAMQEYRKLFRVLAGREDAA
ncbi:hypothetical protein [Alloyangia pacifica]|uniref:hypothetical protein n=1 Tax=Alloyangia pacifica TaxID=311180 RepID=UPI0031CFDE88